MIKTIYKTKDGYLKNMQLKFKEWKKISKIQNIPYKIIKEFYEYQLNEQCLIEAFPEIEERLEYIDNTLYSFIYQYHILNFQGEDGIMEMHIAEDNGEI